MNAIDLLEKQHEKVEDLFGKIEKARSGKEELFLAVYEEYAKTRAREWSQVRAGAEQPSRRMRGICRTFGVASP